MSATAEQVSCLERATFELTRDVCRCPDMFEKANANVNLYAVVSF